MGLRVRDPDFILSLFRDRRDSVIYPMSHQIDGGPVIAGSARIDIRGDDDGGDIKLVQGTHPILSAIPETGNRLQDSLNDVLVSLADILNHNTFEIDSIHESLTEGLGEINRLDEKIFLFNEESTDALLKKLTIQLGLLTKVDFLETCDDIFAGLRELKRSGKMAGMVSDVIIVTYVSNSINHRASASRMTNLTALREEMKNLKRNIYLFYQEISRILRAIRAGTALRNLKDKVEEIRASIVKLGEEYDEGLENEIRGDLDLAVHEAEEIDNEELRQLISVASDEFMTVIHERARTQQPVSGHRDTSIIEGEQWTHGKVGEGFVEICAICQDYLVTCTKWIPHPTVLACPENCMKVHLFHKACLDAVPEIDGEKTCPYDRIAFTDVISFNIDGESDPKKFMEEINSINAERLSRER